MPPKVSLRPDSKVKLSTQPASGRPPVPHRRTGSHTNCSRIPRTRALRRSTSWPAAAGSPSSEPAATATTSSARPTKATRSVRVDHLGGRSQRFHRASPGTARAALHSMVLAAGPARRRCVLEDARDRRVGEWPCVRLDRRRDHRSRSRLGEGTPRRSRPTAPNRPPMRPRHRRLRRADGMDDRPGLTTPPLDNRP